MPQPSKVTAEEMRAVQSTEHHQDSIQIHCLLYLIHRIHLVKRSYTFNTESSNIIDKEFNKYREWVEISNEFDPYLG